MTEPGPYEVWLLVVQSWSGKTPSWVIDMIFAGANARTNAQAYHRHSARGGYLVKGWGWDGDASEPAMTREGEE